MLHKDAETNNSIWWLINAGDPAPEVTWWQDQRLIDRHSEFHNQQDGVRNVLKLERMGRPDLHTSISCQAANTQLSLPLTKALTVEVNRKSISTIVSNLESITFYSPVYYIYIYMYV